MGEFDNINILHPLHINDEALVFNKHKKHILFNSPSNEGKGEVSEFQILEIEILCFI